MRRSGRSLLLFSTLALATGPAMAEQPVSKSATPATNSSPASEPQLPTAADVAVDIVQPGTSAKSVRDSARAAVPVGKLAPEHQRLAQSVLGDISLFRRLPTVRAKLDPRVYQYFIDNPDAAVSIWRVLGISKLELKQKSPGIFEADTGDGSSGTVSLLHRTPTSCIVFCDGLFKSPVLAKPIKARALVTLNAVIEPQADGTTNITHTADMFVSFPSLAVETIARMVSPLSYKYADRNIEEITSFLRMMDVSMSRQPGWIEQIAQLMEGVSEERNRQLLQVTAAVYVDAQRRSFASRGEAFQLKSIQPPVQKVSGAESATRTK
ncbi:hypothetical protein Pan44_44170 [Caulifigura coniformis]|uniref:Uncharacterized protein n=1 Tax=Caulifigura coniformis TaxID=2527983 RepID=A0A517SJQ7_9PLAN|nr:hypothetical protein [Caulifigura coniformis]QDT56363.1 hypothetical protein Pan44_44170 [Caulifigura coniformis]